MSVARFLCPHHEPSAEAHEPRPHVHEPGGLPSSNGPRHGIAPVVLRDVGTEEPPDTTPLTAAGHIPRDGQYGACVRPPPGSPERGGGNRELEARDCSARPEDPRELGQRRRRVRDVTQQVRERERIERLVGEREVFGLPDEELYAVREVRL